MHKAVQQPIFTKQYRYIYFFSCHLSESRHLKIKTLQPIVNVLLKQALIILVPPTQSRTTFSDVSSGPHDSKLIKFLTGLVVRADNVELASTDFIELQDTRTKTG